MTRKSFPRDKHSRVITILVPWPMRPDSLCKASLQRLSHTTSSIPPASRPPAKFANACGTWTRINYPKFSSSWYWKVRIINCGCTSIRKPFSSSVMFSPKIRLHMVVYASFIKITGVFSWLVSQGFSTLLHTSEPLSYSYKRAEEKRIFCTAWPESKYADTIISI